MEDTYYDLVVEMVLDLEDIVLVGHLVVHTVLVHRIDCMVVDLDRVVLFNLILLLISTN